MYSCSKCNKEFNNKKALGGHSTTCGKQIAVNCPICNITIKDANLLNRHVLSHEKDHECAHCTKLTHYKNKYCSRDCWTGSRPKKDHIPCMNCGDVVKKNARSFCSHTCQQEFKYKTFIQQWKDGNESGSQQDGNISSSIRKYIKEKYNNSCSKCNWNEIHPITGNVPVQIDHIDGDHKNNKEENLVLLCPNCHSLTPNFGALNKGHGRDERRKRRMSKYSSAEKKCVLCDHDRDFMNSKGLCVTCYGIYKHNMDNKECLDCGLPIHKQAKRCGPCDKIKQLKVKDRPSHSQLLEDIEATNYTQTGKKYGVSDNTIRKWVKAYERDV
jgi:hypothetical protein